MTGWVATIGLKGASIGLTMTGWGIFGCALFDSEAIKWFEFYADASILTLGTELTEYSELPFLNLAITFSKSSESYSLNAWV